MLILIFVLVITLGPQALLPADVAQRTSARPDSGLIVRAAPSMRDGGTGYISVELKVVHGGGALTDGLAVTAASPGPAFPHASRWR